MTEQPEEIENEEITEPEGTEGAGEVEIEEAETEAEEAEVEQGEANSEPAPRPDLTEHRLRELTRTVEAMLFLSPQSVSLTELAKAIEAPEPEIEVALDQLREDFAPGKRGLVLREVGGGWALAADPDFEAAARSLLAKPRTPPLTQAQAEALAIIAYLQPVARPEIARIRGVASDSALNALTERGLIEEAGRSRFGAVIYTTTPLFLRLFGLGELGDLPDPSKFDPSPEDEREIRERLIKAGEQRSAQ
jgi:segregation and condensation protein B